MAHSEQEELQEAVATFIMHSQRVQSDSGDEQMMDMIDHLNDVLVKQSEMIQALDSQVSELQFLVGNLVEMHRDQ